MTMATPGIAANAYAQLARLGDQVSGGLAKTVGDSPGAASGPNFGDVLKSALQSVEDAGHKSDAQGSALAAGKADLIDVSTAISETETAVQALIAVRDKVIASYQQIMQMPI
jgi:flagellar hook-basal body complex protein FliE